MANTTDRTINVTRTGTESYTYYVTKSRSVYTGFDDITIARPKFIYFRVSGLRPNERHFFFFDNINVTNYVNTSTVTANDFYNLSKNDPQRNPGEKYVNETGFPTELGGPTSEIYSDDTGTIEGVFYLQSNDALSFPAGTRNFTVLDISKFAPAQSTSQATQEFTSDGGIEDYRIDYYRVARTGTRQVSWTETVSNPNYVAPVIEKEPIVIVDAIVDAQPVETVETGGNIDEPPVPFVCGFGLNVTPETETKTETKTETVTEIATEVVNDPIDDGLLGNRNDSVVDEAVIGAAVGIGVAAVASASAAAGVGLGAVVGILAAICCFIMLEARYGDGTMDKVVRRYRDEKMTERNRRGYYKVSEVLVPLMRKSKAAKWIVAKTFADPLVCYGKWYYGENKYGWIFKPVERFWMGVFDTVGGEVQFIRENGEVV
jgi:hypothetical protein